MSVSPDLGPTIRRALVLVLALVMVVAACGIPDDSDARGIPDSALPLELSERAVPTANPDLDGRELGVVWMVDAEDQLVPVERRLVPTADGVLESLLLGTETSEREVGINTAISRGTEFTSPVNVDRVFQLATIDLTAGSLQGTGRGEQRLAVAQIVFTLTELPGVNQVRFRIDGEFTAVPIDSGASGVGQPISPADFPSLTESALPPLVAFPNEQEPTSTPEPNVNTALTIWLIDSEGWLRPVERSLAPDRDLLFLNLLAGPTASEINAGLRSAILADARPLFADAEGSIITVSSSDQTALLTSGVAFVDLAPGSLPIAPDERRLAVAQIVFTLTGLPEVFGVQISVAGEPLLVDRDSQTNAPIRSDFTDLLTLVPTPTPTPTPTPSPTVDPTAEGETGEEVGPADAAEEDGAEGTEPSEGDDGAGDEPEATEPTPTATPSATPTATPTPDP